MFKSPTGLKRAAAVLAGFGVVASIWWVVVVQPAHPRMQADGGPAMTEVEGDVTPDYTFSVSEFVKAYTATITTVEPLVGKKVELTGMVAAVGTTEAGVPYVTFTDGSPVGERRVQCLFDGRNRDEPFAIRAGQKRTLMGTVASFRGDALMKRCVVFR